ncbi:hypothetical protein CDES_06700 [Corynebacterium deserti GIMN1.010]|uniref:Uncharacterized protein n=1 Tax=Corynebacterium deserti GIMN1.010 TaxID=931089 RepID=A0A0M4CXR4_9CORY|nr:hypothetical protein CDES_06700 [Corynebacterium deserti GIMN1.010]
MVFQKSWHECLVIKKQLCDQLKTPGWAVSTNLDFCTCHTDSNLETFILERFISEIEKDLSPATVKVAGHRSSRDTA